MLSKQLQITYSLPVLLKVEIISGFTAVSLLSAAASAPPFHRTFCIKI